MTQLAKHSRNPRYEAPPPAPAAAGVHSGRCEVVHFQRRPGCGAFSVERMCDDIRSALPADIQVTLQVNRYFSRGILGRIRDTLRAKQVSGDVNHVLGDVHYLALLLPRERTILTVLDCVSLQRLGAVKRWLFWLLWYRLPLRRAACVTVISDFTRRTLADLSGYPAERIHVIPPPVSKEFLPSPLPPRSTRARVLQVGTPPNKNLARVIEALAGLPVDFVIIGALSNVERNRLNELGISHESHVGLSRAQLVDQYRRADAVIFASTYEGFGLPIVEAQATGRPVITSTIAPMPETAGGAACLVDPFDVADIRRGVRAVIGDPAYAMDLVRRGFENVKRFAPERIAEQYAAIYRDIKHGQESPA